MLCGSAVIVSNTSSMPEIIGRQDALFDPYDEDALAAKLHHVLTDDEFRLTLQKHGIEQAKEFSWDKSAQCALKAIEDWHNRYPKRPICLNTSNNRPKLAYISPLPPERSGISDYSAELLPVLYRFYDIEVIVTQESVSDPWVNANCPIRTVEWFKDHGKNYYDRVLYHIGNSSFHQHMLALLEQIPGVVVLHDFFLSGLIAYLDNSQNNSNHWATTLYDSHGYQAVYERTHTNDLYKIILKYPCNFNVLKKAYGVIVHSEHAKSLAIQFYGAESTTNWSIIPLLKKHNILDKAKARRALGLSMNDFIVCSFGFLNPAKLNHQLLKAWLLSRLAQDQHCLLIFVGEGDYAELHELRNQISHKTFSHRIHTTGWVDKETYNHYLAAADVAVQLRTNSRGKTSASIIDSMGAGLPTITNSHGSIAELPDDCVLKLPEHFTDIQLAESLEKLKDNPSFHHNLGHFAKEFIKNNHAPSRIAQQYFESIENSYQGNGTILPSLIKAIAHVQSINVKSSALMTLAKNIANSISPPLYQKQLLLDISMLVKNDDKTGTPRLIRAILWQWLLQPPAGYRVEPIYHAHDKSYRYARRFIFNFLDCPKGILEDDLIEYHEGDIYLSLAHHSAIVTQEVFFQSLRNHGVEVQFLVYDLLPIQLPQAFSKPMDKQHRAWLAFISKQDAAICISKSVANELKTYLNEFHPANSRLFNISWIHCGADIESSMPTFGLPDNAENILTKLESHPSFLMVATIEPRKGHIQTLATFEKLWSEQHQVILVMVGKYGWMMESFIEKLNSHPELGRRLFWLNSISDEFLKQIYAVSSCLIAASLGEGFGLPLIEAAQHQLPIIARDIPVFREVAGEYAYYFEGISADALATAIKKWLLLYKTGLAPRSDNMPWLTWEESAKQLANVVFSKKQVKKNSEQIEEQQMITQK